MYQFTKTTIIDTATNAETHCHNARLFNSGDIVNADGRRYYVEHVVRTADTQTLYICKLPD